MLLLRLFPLLLCLSALVAGPETSLKLVWSDEFNDKELDKKKWNIGNASGVRLVDGQLSLEITPGSKPMFWRGSNVDTRGKYSSKDGFIEASILFVQTGGHGCGFGIRNQDDKPPSAGMSFSNGGGSTVGLGLYMRNEERGRTLNPKENPIPKDDTYSKKFHRFGFQWGPAGYRWYVDGRLYNTILISPHVLATPKPMYIGLSHNGLPEAGLLKNFKDPKMGPEPMRVDWVKVYQ
ncbi:MAG: glycoside hydrolase family 16 protein [Opitutales bacterium]